MNVNVTGLVKAEQHGLGVIVNLLKGMIEPEASTSRSSLTRKCCLMSPMLNAYNVALLLATGDGRASSRKSWVAPKSLLISSNTRNASSDVQAVSSAECPGAGNRTAEAKAVAISFSNHHRTSAGADLICSAVNVKLVMGGS